MTARRRSETLLSGFASLYVVRMLTAVCALIYALVPPFAMCECTGRCIATEVRECVEKASQQDADRCDEANMARAMNEGERSCCDMEKEQGAQDSDPEKSCYVDFNKDVATASASSSVETSSEQLVDLLWIAFSEPSDSLLSLDDEASFASLITDPPVPSLRRHLLLNVLRN